ncbi:hypothetical protein SSX86_000258 [Deinandra increscens subsp. villosa]|uniref:Transposase, Ptta/En/Spm, plant n=1 Tax=Deinandra increscens subsp. villosa TaxID=3103831 RepID=A0AAP0DST6_9ASTR
MARTRGACNNIQYSGRSGGRGVSQGSDRGGGRGVSQGSDIGGGRGVSQDSNRGGGRGVSQGSNRGGDRGVSQGSDRGGGQSFGRGAGHTIYQAGDQVLGQGSGLFISQGSGQTGDQGPRRYSGIGNSTTVRLESDTYDDPIEGSDDDIDDDESTLHVATKRRGEASQVQVPEPMNRDWIWIKDGEFNNQGTSTRIIGVSLKAMWNGPWDSWRDVPNEDKKRLWERFKSYYQWDKKWDTQIYSCWEKCIAVKFPSLLKTVRNHAKATARSKGLEVNDDMSVLIEFKPPWIRSQIWKEMVDLWNSPKWKEKSKRNKDIRIKSCGSKHTLGSQSYVTAKRKAAERIGRDLLPHEMWKQAHCRKGSRPLDKVLLLEGNVDLEGNVEGQNLMWDSDSAKETWDKYAGYIVEKYGDYSNRYDEELWEQASEDNNKGKLYGLSNASDPSIQGRQDPEIEKLNEVIKDLVRENEAEKERLNGRITELMTENETLHNRVKNIEDMLKTMSRR